MRITEPESVNPTRSVDGLSRDKSNQNQQITEDNSNETGQNNKLNKDKFSLKKKREDLSESDVKEAVEDLQLMNEFIDKGFDFNVHEKTDRIWVEVVDRENDEVIREIPPEDILDIVAGLKEIVGLIVDEEI